MANDRPSNRRLSNYRISGEFHQAVVDCIDEGRQIALAVVLNATGSTPRSAGTKAIIDATGSIWGTIGGGLLESEAQRRAIEAIRTRGSALFDFKMAGEEPSEDERVCDGTVRMLIDPVTTEQRSVYFTVAEAMRRRERGVLLTTIGAGDERATVQWLPQRKTVGDVDSRIAKAIESAANTGEPQYLACDDTRSPSPSPPFDKLTAGGPSPIEGEGDRNANTSEGASLEGLAEPVIPTPLLIISGGGHVGRALAEQARLVGFDIVLVEDRPEFADAALYPSDLSIRRGKLANLLGELPITRDVYIAIVGRGQLIDAEALAACIGKPAAYIGMLGSRRKVALMRKGFLETGKATAEQFDRIHAPIGLEIGAETVPEIAASIVAELIAVRRKSETADRCR
jgi:xanthine dehydrogenase accessory factor